MKSLNDGARRLRHFGDILNGVEAAHLLGVIHRDLKPENVFVDGDRLIVGDFGIAYFVDEDLYTAADTRDGQRLANFIYAAPEQRVREERVDARADIYALGLILNELFTGHVPHGTSYRRIEDVFPEYRWLDALVETMLRQRRDERPESIEAVKRTLIAYQQDYVTRQRLEALQNRVVPAGEITEPLALTPLRVVDFEYAKGELTLILSSEVNEGWRQAFFQFNYRRALMMHPPGRFSIAGNQARVAVEEREVQQVIDYFKEWLPLVTEHYHAQLERRLRMAEAQRRAAVIAEKEELERQKRLRDSIRL